MPGQTDRNTESQRFMVGVRANHHTGPAGFSCGLAGPGFPIYEKILPDRAAVVHV